MNLTQIKKMVASGELHKPQVDYLFARIDKAEEVIRSIARCSARELEHHLPRSQAAISISHLASDYLTKFEEKNDERA